MRKRSKWSIILLIIVFAVSVPAVCLLEAVGNADPIYEDAAARDQALDTQKKLAIRYVSEGKNEEAESTVADIIAEFSDHAGLADAINQVAHQYRDRQNYRKALQLYGYVVNNCSENQHAMWAQAAIVKSNIDIGDQERAVVSTLKLVNEFSDHKHIAKAVHDIAHEYRDLGKYEFATELHQHVVDNYSSRTSDLWGDASVAMSNIAIGRDEVGQAIAERILDKYSNRKGLPQATLFIGEEYYNEALRDIREGRQEDGLARLSKARALFEVVISRFNESNDAFDALNLAAECCRQWGDYEKAIAYYGAAIEKRPDYEYAWNTMLLIARCYEQMKVSGLMGTSEADNCASALYEQLVEGYPSCPAAKIARRWLTENTSN
jgi:tetratricopeptide (TPR) repeat protein